MPTQQEPGLSIALKTDAIGLIDCMLSAITSQGWTLLVPEPLERSRKVDDSLVLKQYTMKSKSIQVLLRNRHIAITSDTLQIYSDTFPLIVSLKRKIK